MEVVGGVERRRRWLRRQMRHEGQTEGGCRGIRRTIGGVIEVGLVGGGSFSGVVGAAHSWDVARGERLCNPAVSLELEKYLLVRYRFHIEAYQTEVMIMGSMSPKNKDTCTSEYSPGSPGNNSTL